MHEAPPVMYVPLIILAIASVVGGWLNVPAAIKQIPVLGWVPSSEWLHEWLHPVVAAADHVIEEHVGELAHSAPIGGGEALWAVISLAIATAVVVVAARMMLRRKRVPASEAAAPAGFGRVLYNKWYVDELYDRAIVQPVIRVSRAFWKYVDQGIIDGLVNGAGSVSRSLGWAGSRLQTGQLNTYAFAIVVGVLFVLGFMVLR
jgi:NADH-quinone oxidoreductase subunit L